MEVQKHSETRAQEEKLVRGLFSTRRTGGNPEGRQNLMAILPLRRKRRAEREQSRNGRPSFPRSRRKALEKLRRILEAEDERRAREQRGVAWMAGKRLVRGNPVRVYEGEGFTLKK